MSFLPSPSSSPPSLLLPAPESPCPRSSLVLTAASISGHTSAKPVARPLERSRGLHAGATSAVAPPPGRQTWCRPVKLRRQSPLACLRPGAVMDIAASIRRRRWTPPPRSGRKPNPGELLVPDPAFPKLSAASRVHADAVDLLQPSWPASSVSQSSETDWGCEDLFNYIGSSTSWIRSSSKRNLSCRYR